MAHANYTYAKGRSSSGFGQHGEAVTDISVGVSDSDPSVRASVGVGMARALADTTIAHERMLTERRRDLLEQRT